MNVFKVGDRVGDLRGIGPEVQGRVTLVWGESVYYSSEPGGVKHRCQANAPGTRKLPPSRP